MSLTPPHPHVRKIFWNKNASFFSRRQLLFEKFFGTVHIEKDKRWLLRSEKTSYKLFGRS